MFKLIKILIVLGIGLFAYWFATKATPEQRQAAQDVATSFTEDIGKTIKGVGEDLKKKGAELYDNRDELLKEAKTYVDGAKTQIAQATEGFVSSGSDYDEKHLYGGVPVKTTYPNAVKVLRNKGFVVGYDEKRNNPAWVGYRVFKDEIGKGDKRPSRFKVDTRTTSKVSHNDYTNSGYDRGHMAPNWTTFLRFGREAQLETFLMSNVVPQKPQLNRGIWRELEETVAKDYGNECEVVWVITGPIYDDEAEFISDDIEIPDAFFKIIIDELNDKPRALAYNIDQNLSGEDDLDNYRTSIDELETKAGFDFAPVLDDEVEAAFESKLSRAGW
jgi:endonuclease G